MADKDVKMKALMKTNLEIQSENEHLNELLSSMEDHDKHLQESDGLVTSLRAQKDQMVKEVNNAGDYLLEVEEKCTKANTTAHELLNQLKEADGEIESLKARIKQL